MIQCCLIYFLKSKKIQELEIDATQTNFSNECSLTHAVLHRSFSTILKSPSIQIFKVIRQTLEQLEHISDYEFGINLMIAHFPEMYFRNNIFLFKYAFTRFEGYTKIITIVNEASKNKPMKNIYFDENYGFNKQTKGTGILTKERLNFWLLNSKSICPTEFHRKMEHLQLYVVKFFYFIFSNKLNF